MKYLVFLFLYLFLHTFLQAQDTFSIVAVDSVTGEVGSAGASCLDNSVIAGGAYIISDVLPGKGAIHTQSFYFQQNQQNANFRLSAGQSPQQVIDWLVQNDALGDSTIRQYGIAAFDPSGSPMEAAFTGSNCFNYKSHRLGKGYAIQGNILLGAGILDSMEARFLREAGPLANRLMAALQGANIPGADSRCLMEGVSSQSAFIRVAKPGDTPGNFYLDINVSQTPFGEEPIDSVQNLFDQWNMTLTVSSPQALPRLLLSPNPMPGETRVSIQGHVVGKSYQIEAFDLTGKRILGFPITRMPFTLTGKDLGPSGTYILKLSEEGKMVFRTLLVLQQ